jgi:hypothetical protein
MTIQTLKDVELPNGVRIRAGAVLKVPDETGLKLIQEGSARLRERPGPVEQKGVEPVLNPGDPLPPAAPYIRVPAGAQPAASFEPGAYEDQDNFVRDLVTLVSPYDWWDGAPPATPAPPVTPPPSASSRAPVLTLAEIKLHCRIELDQTDEDSELTNLEMAARIHTENYLRYQIDATVGENVKQALLMLIAFWYRSREAVGLGRAGVGDPLPLAYQALLSAERDYPIY